MALPTLTPEQHDKALAKSREAHQACTTLLAGIKSGAEKIPAVLDRAQSDPIPGQTKVSQLVRVLPGYRLTKTHALLQEAASPRTGAPPASEAASPRRCSPPRPC
jgi:hypothetical protein